LALPSAVCCAVLCSSRRAQAALDQYTRQTIADLQADDDEMLRGVDWKAVAAAANLSQEVKQVLKSTQSMKQEARNKHTSGTELNTEDDLDEFEDMPADLEPGLGIADRVSSKAHTRASFANTSLTGLQRIGSVAGSVVGQLKVPLLSKAMVMQGVQRYPAAAEFDEEELPGKDEQKMIRKVGGIDHLNPI
jgi:hypothetical protein